ncbi:LXG domain-containing protein [Lentibacillus sp. N15]|uniref:LXG domain-containing protein n=1 Tax=Lentibacillus songyuanensis TaxID=3136161 RepID=UPI0031BB9819
MKTLDVASLHDVIEATKKEITNVTDKLTDVQTGVQGIIDLQYSLKGKTGDSIRSFYESIHEPFLIYLCESLSSYAEILDQVQSAVSDYEGNDQGFVEEEFLDVDVQNGFDKVEKIAGELVDEANAILSSISDLVSIPAIDMEELGSAVQQGKNKGKNQIDQLHELDNDQIKTLSQVGEDQQVLKQ